MKVWDQWQQIRQSIFDARSVTIPWVSCFRALSRVAQGPPEAVILEQELKEASRVLQQQQWEDERAREQVILQRRLARQFATLQVKATAQHAMIGQ